MGADKTIWALGLMSGTSMDGVDAAMILTDGERIADFGPSLFLPYSEADRALLRRALAEAPGLSDRRDRPGVLSEAEALVDRRHLEACRALLARSGSPRAEVIGYHGQTVFHAPDRGLTIQIGRGDVLAEGLGLTVVHDLRAADVAAGGQGAPLVPVFHRALAEKAGLTLPVAIVNVGGDANVTLISEDGELLAFDTGPGNAPVDDLMREATGRPFDTDGALAGAGRADEDSIRRWMTHPFFAEIPPKSLDRQAFSRGALSMPDGLPLADQAATLTAFSAEAIAAGLARRPSIGRAVVGGGGARNPTLMRMIAERAGVSVMTADSVGLSGDFLEAQAFGYLAVRSLAGLPLTFPGTTGVLRPTSGGVVSTPEARRRVGG